MHLKSLKIGVLVAGWLFVQLAVLRHEFSEEHWSASTDHVCFAQAAHLDDLLTNDYDLTPAIVVAYEQKSFFEYFHHTDLTKFKLACARAPPA